MAPMMTDNIVSLKEEDKILTELKRAMQDFLGDRMVRLTLFGSRARGDYSDGSDVDIAIIVRGLTRELKHQILEKIAEIELRYFMPISAIILSEEEFNRLKRQQRRIALDIEREGVKL
ncbi:MAG: nucleotidyltransferase domain-containing protein [Thermoproteota archaeon]|nr:MAG: nucleotidyltransferase domain-containing protein [Candidatus Korarchaeota archaeon]